MRKTTTTRAAVFAGIAVLAAGTLAGCAANSQPGSGSAGDGKNSLEITSWWTSGSEADALKVLTDAVKAKDPSLNVENAAVSGGGGANAQQALAARLQAGNPPDTWQLHPVGQLRSYAQAGQVADVSDLWSKNGWDKVVPADVAESQSVDGKYYSVPIGVHRGNVLWTNPSVLKKAGVTIDPKGDIDALLADLQKVADSGTTAVCLGDKDIFASSELLESLIMARAGADNWRNIFTGKYTFDSPEVKQALKDYAAVLKMANSDHSALTWDEAAKNLAQGKCAANLMGDWAYGELINAGFKPGTDFQWVIPTGKEDVFDYVGDSFAVPAKNAPNEKAGKEWLTVLMDPKVQTDFAAKKGSIPARSDADVSSLSEYQQSAVASFKVAKIVNSFAHGNATTAEFAQTYADAVATFNGDGNVDAFIATMNAAQKNQL